MTPKLRDQPEAAEERDRNPHAWSRRRAAGSRNSARHTKTRTRPRRALRSSRSDALPQDDRVVVPGGDLDAGGKRGRRVLDVAACTLRATSSALLLADPEDLDQHGALAVEAGRGVGVLEAVDDRGHVPEQRGGSPSGRVRRTTMSLELARRGRPGPWCGAGSRRPRS